MSLNGWILVAVVLAALVLLTDVVQLIWVSRRSNPDRGPRSRDDWERTTAADLITGDVVLASSLSPKPETVVGIEPAADDLLVLTFRSGRTCRTKPTTPVRRHPAPSPPPRSA